MQPCQVAKKYAAVIISPKRGYIELQQGFYNKQNLKLQHTVSA